MIQIRDEMFRDLDDRCSHAARIAGECEVCVAFKNACHKYYNNRFSRETFWTLDSAANAVLAKHVVDNSNPPDIHRGIQAIIRLQIEVLSQLRSIKREGVSITAIGKDILDAVTQENSVIDSFLVLVQGLIDNNTISSIDGKAILDTINAQRDKVQAAIVANTPLTPPAPSVAPSMAPSAAPAPAA